MTSSHRQRDTHPLIYGSHNPNWQPVPDTELDGVLRIGIVADQTPAHLGRPEIQAKMRVYVQGIMRLLHQCGMKEERCAVTYHREDQQNGGCWRYASIDITVPPEIKPALAKVLERTIPADEGLLSCWKETGCQVEIPEVSVSAEAADELLKRLNAPVRCIIGASL